MICIDDVTRTLFEKHLGMKKRAFYLSSHVSKCDDGIQIMVNGIDLIDY